VTTAYATFADTDPLPTEHLLGGGSPLIPRGDVTGIYGDGGLGKGRMIMSFVAEVANDGGTVIVILPEDHPNEQVRPRLESAGVRDMSRVVNLTRLPGGSRFKLSAAQNHDGDLGLLREAVEVLSSQGHDVRLVVIDPVAAVIGWGSINTNQGARRVVEGLQDLAADTGVSVILVAHTVKSGSLQGSAGLEQALRLLYRVSKDPSNPLVRVLSVAKTNNTGASEDLRFVIEDAGDGPRVVWLDAAEIARRQMSWRKPPDAGASALILSALRCAMAPLSVAQLADMTGISIPVTRSLLWRMRQRGQVASNGKGEYRATRIAA
jgi:predicted ATP-dependent serine protease